MPCRVVRIYISQRADIDHYMGMAVCKNADSTSKAAIAVKSDVVRIQGRENIVIATGKGKAEGGSGAHDEKNSKGGIISHPGSINFVAGNYTEDEPFVVFNVLNVKDAAESRRKKLQPVVKGDDLKKALDDAMEIMMQCLEVSMQNTAMIQKLAKNYKNHIHDATPGFGGPSSPSFKSMAWVPAVLAPLNIKQKAVAKNIKIQSNYWKNNYLSPYGSKYINSPHVKTT